MYSTPFLLALLLSPTIVCAQQAADKPAAPAQATATVIALPTNPSKMAEVIRGSYYHPDDLASLDCSVSIDWVKFFSALKTNLPDDRLKLLQGLKIHSHAVRGKVPELTYDWTAGNLSTKDQMESGFNQAIGGFYQMYWSILGGSLVKTGDDIKKVELLPDGSANVDLSSDGASFVAAVNNDGSLGHMVLDSPAMKGTIDPQYVASPHPVPGDLRRISNVKVVERIGESNINAELSVDYQEAGGFVIPKSVLFTAAGAFSLPIEFSSCTASRAESGH
jgi:hypothetical protein